MEKEEEMDEEEVEEEVEVEGHREQFSFHVTVVDLQYSADDVIQITF